MGLGEHVTTTMDAHREERPRQVRDRARYSAWAYLTPLLGILLGLALLYGLMRVVQAHYEGRIFPGVSVQGVSLGGMTPDEARHALQGLLEPGSPGTVAFTDGQEEWVAPWRELGVTPDIEGAVAAAYAIGHADTEVHPRDWVRTWLADHQVQAPLVVNAVVAREALAATAEALNRAPTAGRLELRGDEVTVVPGTPGRALDVDTSLDALLAVAQGAPEPVWLTFREVPAPEPDPAPLQTEVDSLLERTVTVSTYDPVSDQRYEWELGRAAIVHWLQLELDEDGAARRVAVDDEAVKATLATLAEDWTDGRGFQPDEAATIVREAFEGGGGRVTLRIAYPERRYTVQAGDTALAVAARHGMPFWHLAEANPDVDLNALTVGQELIIPSQDVLLPHPPVPYKRIVISLAEQRMRVYENGAVIHDWLVATGRDGSPTLPGVFQVLSKEENAYASLWDLEMPHFIGIYVSGPGFTNGIHALPILSSGQRLWEGALGTRASYGCVILGIREAEELYNWAELGVTVEVRP
jgi:LysM repeat protein